MSSSAKIFSLSAIDLTGILREVAAPSPQASQTQSCLIPLPGNYSFESIAMTGELVGVGQAFVLALENAPPMGNLGVWTVTNADQGGFHIFNVELARNVTTTHFVESLAAPGQPATTYAIECADANPPQYVIKAIDADQSWTTVPGTAAGDAEEGVAHMEMLPADGSNEQRFILHAL